MTDPRVDAVASIIADAYGGSPQQNTARAAAERVLAALDEMHVHDQRGNMGWNDETEPEEEACLGDAAMVD